MTSIKQFRREENIIIPSKNFITTLLNISEDMLEECIVAQFSNELGHPSRLL